MPTSISVPEIKPGLIGPAVVDMCPVVPVEEIFPTNQVIDIGGILKGSQGVCVRCAWSFPRNGCSYPQCVNDSRMPRLYCRIMTVA